MTEFSAEEVAKLAEVFPPVRSARMLLREAGYPMTELPGAPDTALGFWEQVSESLGNGVLRDGRLRILRAAARRYPDQPVFAADAVTRWRVLVVGASPEGAARIRPDREAKAIEAVAATGGNLLVRYCPAAQATDLRHALDFRPDIVHLACHGDGTDLIFEDVLGGAHRVAAKDVVGTLRLYQDLDRMRLRGLVLSSCDGEQIASAFTGVAGRVIAHRGPLDDECAVVFAGHLYQELAGTRDLGAAARLAAQHTLLTDQTCAGVAADLLVLPQDGGGHDG